MEYNDPIFEEATETAKEMVRKGHAEDAIMDGMLTLTVTWALGKEGPRAVSNRLYGLALQAAAMADLIERDREGTAH